VIIIISAQQPSLESPIDSRFGRSLWLVRVDTETNKWDALTNPGANQAGGAGVAAAQFVINQKANAVISGNFGPNAANAFQRANINMHLFANNTSTVQEAIDHFKQGILPVFR